MSERLYADLAPWWAVISPPEVYADEARDLLAVARAVLGRRVGSVLELGCGAGLLASHWPRGVRATLVDRSPEMLAESRRHNPKARHVQGDLRALDLGETFDLVLLHDAVMYLTSESDLQAAMRVVAAHVARDGVALVIPDIVAEDFVEGHVAGGGTAPDGRSARLLEWHWDPDPGDATYRAEMAFLLRERDGTVRCVHETHTMGLFDRRTFGRALRKAGLTPADAPRKLLTRLGEVFVARRAQ